MSHTYTVGRSANALIRIPKQHDTVGKLHLEIEDLGQGWVTVKDLNSANGTFHRVKGKWEELKAPRTISIDAELMLGSYVTTSRVLLAGVAASETPRKDNSGAKEPPAAPPEIPPRKASRMRRNEFGEIVSE
jgi:hypothetical protein